MRLTSLSRSLMLVFIALTLSLAGCGPQPERSFSVPEPRAYTRITPPNPDDPLNAHIYELNNGLTVYLSENREEPRFHAEIAVRAGSKHDPADATGLAHYLEHLLFNGSESLGTLDHAAEAPYLAQIYDLYEAHFVETDEQLREELYEQINSVSREAARYAVPNEIDKLYNAMGASGLNAHTWHEETVYRVSLPSNRMEQWAAIESDRFRNPVFRLFHTELEVVYEEKNRTLDNRNRVSSYALTDLLFPTHPYGQQPTIGHAEHLRNPSLRYIREYFDTWYVPNNMAIIISGDIDIDATIELIAEYFGDWQPNRLPAVGPWPEAPITEARSRTVHYPGQEEVRLAWRTVPHGHPDHEALILLDMILDNRSAGLINLNLNQQQRVQSAGASPQFLNDHGYQQLWGSPRAGQTLEEVEALLLEQLRLVQQGEFEDWLIPAIVNDFKRMEKRSLESNSTRAATMRRAFLHRADWYYFSNQIERMERLSGNDIMRVANQYFGDNNHVAVYRRNGPADIPQVDKPQIDALDIDPSRQSGFAGQILAMEATPIEPRFLEEGRDYELLDYAPGVPLYYAGNPLNDLFNFSITIEKGSDDDAYLGLAASLLELAGTDDHDPQALQQQWYRLGSNFRVSTGANSTTFSVTGMDNQFAQSLRLMFHVIERASSDESTLDQLRTRVLQARQNRRQDPAALAQALYLYNRYGDQSPMLRGLDRDALMATEADDLLARLPALLRYQHSLSYTGSMTPQRLLNQLPGLYQPRADLIAPPPYQLRRARQVDNNEIYVVHQDTAQAQLRIEFSDGVFNERQSVPATLFNNYFGLGMSSVVFQELREARALAYSASARYAQGSRLADENLMLGAVGTQHDKAVEALTVFNTLIDTLPVSDDRFEETLSSVINRSRAATVGFRQVNSTVRGWHQLGFEHDPRPVRFATLLDSDINAMLDFHQQHVAGRAKLISLVGNLDRMDMDALAEIGSVHEMTIDQLFID
jgi:predicted Zn-dependent peptidase